jgi:hypothetical protein
VEFDEAIAVLTGWSGQDVTLVVTSTDSETHVEDRPYRGVLTEVPGKSREDVRIFVVPTVPPGRHRINHAGIQFAILRSSFVDARWVGYGSEPGPGVGLSIFTGRLRFGVFPEPAPGGQGGSLPR